MPGSIVGYIISNRLRRVNLAAISIPTNKPKTEAFRASEGLNASRIQGRNETWQSNSKYPRALFFLLSCICNHHANPARIVESNDMKWKIANMLDCRYLLSALILLVGLGSSVAIYLTAENGSDYGLINDFENSKTYTHDLELYGGKANVLANELGNWFSGLWHGQSLAFTVAFITIVVSLGFFFAAPGLRPGDRGKIKRDGTV
jgi:hypothetical protein